MSIVFSLTNSCLFFSFFIFIFFLSFLCTPSSTYSVVTLSILIYLFSFLSFFILASLPIPCILDVPNLSICIYPLYPPFLQFHPRLFLLLHLSFPPLPLFPSFPSLPQYSFPKYVTLFSHHIFLDLTHTERIVLGRD